MSALDNYLRNHKDFCHNHEYPSGDCFCGRNEAAAELAQLRAAHDEMEGIIGELKFNDAKLRADLIQASSFIDELRHERIALKASLSAAQKRVESARKVIDDFVMWLENVDHSYANGNSACGCDEGEVLGTRGECELLKAAAAWLAEEEK